VHVIEKRGLKYRNKDKKNLKLYSSFISLLITSTEFIPSASALKLVIMRWRKTGIMDALTSSILGVNLPLITARVFAANIKY
jgi:hypothetical protein